MSMLDTVKGLTRKNHESHEVFYQIVAREFQEGQLDGALFMKALQQAEGNQEKANGIYVGLRVEKIERETIEQNSNLLRLSAAQSAAIKENEEQQKRTALSSPEYYALLRRAMADARTLSGLGIPELIFLNVALGAFISYIFLSMRYFGFEEAALHGNAISHAILSVLIFIGYLFAHFAIVRFLYFKTQLSIPLAEDSLLDHLEELERYANMGSQDIAKILSNTNIKFRLQQRRLQLLKSNV